MKSAYQATTVQGAMFKVLKNKSEHQWIRASGEKLIVDAKEDVLDRIHEALMLATCPRPCGQRNVSDERERVCRVKYVRMRLMPNRIDLFDEPDSQMPTAFNVFKKENKKEPEIIP